MNLFQNWVQGKQTNRWSQSSLFVETGKNSKYFISFHTEAETGSGKFKSKKMSGKRKKWPRFRVHLQVSRPFTSASTCEIFATSAGLYLLLLLLETNFGGTEGEDRQVGRWFGCGSATGSSRWSAHTSRSGGCVSSRLRSYYHQTLFRNGRRTDVAA